MGYMCLFQPWLMAQMVKRLLTMRVDLGSIPGLGRSLGEGNGNPFQYPAWKVPWMGEPGRPTVHGVEHN